MRPKDENKGIAAIEIMVVLAVLLAALTVAVPIFLQKVPVDRENVTIKKLYAIKKAIVGYHEKIDAKAQSSFGFVGDLGVLPNDLDELVEQRTYPDYNQSNNVWFGWRGPYLNSRADLVDEWNERINWEIISEIEPSSGRLRIRRIHSNNVSSFSVYIYEDEVSNFVSGGILTREFPHIALGDYTGVLSIYYPNGSTVISTEVDITAGIYDSQAVSARIPVGHRYFATQDNEFQRLATLARGGNSVVNFVGEVEEMSGFEHDFSNKDNLTFIGGGGGAWKNDVNQDGDYLYYQGSAREGERVVAFGNAAWVDYSIEADVAITDERQAEGFGIDYRANYSGDPTPDSGYRFTYYPDGSSHFTIKRIPNDFVPAKPDYAGYGFGYFKFFISVQTNGSVITHTIRIEKRVGVVFVQQTSLSFDEAITVDSSLSGQVGFMVFGHQDSVKIHHVIVTLL